MGYVTKEQMISIVQDQANKIQDKFDNSGGSELIGDLANLNTTNKTNLVSAINEVNNNIGNISTLLATI